MKKLWAPVAVAVSLIVLSGCAADVTSPGSSGSDAPVPADSAEPPAAPGEVFGQGMVLQVGEALPQLCLGAVMESYPPQCSGVEVLGWDWKTVDQSETASDVTWGGYAVQGTWDGAKLTVTQPPIPLSLFDPMMSPDPYLDESNPGPSSEDQITRMLDEVPTIGIPGYVVATAANGYLFVEVVHDVQPAQSILDTRYGPGVVVVRPALEPVE